MNNLSFAFISLVQNGPIGIYGIIALSTVDMERDFEIVLASNANRVIVWLLITDGVVVIHTKEQHVPLLHVQVMYICNTLKSVYIA